MTDAKFDVYSHVTEQIIAQIEAGTAHSDVSGRSFRQHPVSYSGVSGHLRIVAA